jgi:DNA-binding NarL/FixJ family response regulator
VIDDLSVLSSDLVSAGGWQNAEQALAGVAEFQPDIVFTEVNVPGMNGVEFIRQLKAVSPPSRFVVLTWNADRQSILDAFKVGASGYLLKGDCPEIIFEAIRELNNGSIPLSLNVIGKLLSVSRTELQARKGLPITEREEQVLDYLAQGKMYKEIAYELSITVETAKKHIKNIYQKLHVQNRIEAVNIWRNV